MSLTPEEQKKLAIYCLNSAPICRNPSIISFDLKELAAYTAAVEAKEREKCNQERDKLAQSAFSRLLNN